MCRVKMTEALDLPLSQPLQRGLVLLYDELLQVVRISMADDTALARQRFVTATVTSLGSREHAQEAHQMGYTITQLVRGYGSICQGITEFAKKTGTKITPAEFAQLNLGLDVAIAQAVTEFQSLGKKTDASGERLRVGSLVHELRNHLTSAVLAHELIRMGDVGASGATSAVLTNSLRHMREIIDRSVADIRLSSASDLNPTVFGLLGLVSEVESSLAAESNAKHINVQIEADPTLEIEADQHLMISAITNLVQNAIKFTHVGGSVWIRAFADGADAVIEIEDRCGGLPDGKTEALFAPFIQEGADKSGMGLGLTIVQRAADANRCTLEVRNLPTMGCVFSLRLPAYVTA